MAEAYRKKPAAVVGVTAGALLLAVVLTAGGSNTITGTTTLFDDAFGSMEDGSYCSGNMAGLGYGDMSAGLPVVVRDGSGDIAGSTTLGSGEVVGFGCEFSFRVEVEAADRYEVEAGSRGSLYYTADELEDNNWEVDLSLGDD